MKFSSTNREETEGETAAAEEPFWRHRIAIKHYFCMSTDWQSVMRSMHQIATALANDPMFDDFAPLEEFFAEGSLTLPPKSSRYFPFFNTGLEVASCSNLDF